MTIVPYLNSNGNSSILSYLEGVDYIIVEFKPNKTPGYSFYRYDYVHSGLDAIEQMKHLARRGFGLNTYIRIHSVQHEYTARGSSIDDVAV